MSVPVKWEWTFGPASILSILQIGTIFGTLFYFGGAWVTASEASKDTSKQLQKLIEKQQDQQHAFGDRLIKVETNLEYVSGNVRDLGVKLDSVQRELKPK